MVTLPTYSRLPSYLQGALMAVSGPEPAEGPVRGMLPDRLPPERAARLYSFVTQSVGHEIPNSLIGVQGLARLLDAEEGERLSVEGRDYLRRLTAASQRGLNLLRVLADVLRTIPEAPSGTPTPVADIATEAIAELMVLASRPTIGYDIPQTELTVHRGAAEIRQALSLLLRLLAQYPPRDRPAELRLGAQATADGLEIWVRDSGSPWPPGELERLFEPFALRGPSGEPNFQAFLAREVIEGLGGRLTVQAPAGEGPTFTLSLPAPASPTGPTA